MNLNFELNSTNGRSVSKTICSVSNKITIIVLLICALSSAALFTVTNGLQFVSALEQIASNFDLYCPEITIIDGKAVIKEKQPYFVPTPPELNLALVIDTRDKPEPRPLSLLKDSSTGVVLSRSLLIVKNHEEMTTIKLENFPDLTMNSQTISEALRNYRSTMIFSLLFAALIYYGISKTLQSLISGMAILLVVRYFSIQVSLGRGFKLSTFVLVPATLVDLILKSFNILPELQLFIYLGCCSGVLFWMVKDFITNSSQHVSVPQR
ncbi:MAG: DUF1189 family protein [Deltaproteobacteria bacterium]|nr:DUF1189 family protein [Deltaproteobacteria bacterium]